MHTPYSSHFEFYLMYERMKMFLCRTQDHQKLWCVKKMLIMWKLWNKMCEIDVIKFYFKKKEEGKFDLRVFLQ